MAIALDVAGELGLPELDVAVRSSKVLGATVPEASINEHHNPRRGEDYVWAATQAWYGGEVLAETKAATV